MGAIGEKDDTGGKGGPGRRAALVTGAVVVAGAGLALYDVLRPEHENAGPGARRPDAHGLPPRREGDVDYVGAQWVPASHRNYRLASRPYDFPINLVVIHVVQGGYRSALQVFKERGYEASSHYVLRKDGHVAQSVRERDVAFQTGNSDYNDRAVGIEHEGYIDQPSFAEAMYASSARLTADICRRYRIPLDRKHIIGHYQVPDQDHTDPGEHWDWAHYMALVHRAAASPSPHPSPATPSPSKSRL